MRQSLPRMNLPIDVNCGCDGRMVCVFHVSVQLDDNEAKTLGQVFDNDTAT